MRTQKAEVVEDEYGMVVDEEGMSVNLNSEPKPERSLTESGRGTRTRKAAGRLGW